MVICIDTATKEAGITLVDTKQCYGYLPFEENHYSDRIIANIDELLTRASVELKDLTAVFAVIGPGSFTGLRVGIAVANQFSHQLDIPIIGLKTNEWWTYRTDETDYLFLQSLNKSEVYAGDGIKKVSDINGGKWMGQLTDAHRSELQYLHQITEIRDPEHTWLKVIQSVQVKKGKKYDLLEPFYGKEPNITPSKNRLTI